MISQMAALVLLAAGSVACGQVLVNEPFETEGQTSGFTCNGNQMLFGGGNPGFYLGVPEMDFQGISLRSEEPGNPMTGNIARHGGAIRISVDIAVFTLRGFFGQDIDPQFFPITLQLFDDPAVPGEDVPVSVYVVGPGLPRPTDGWVRFQFVIPDPTQTALPAGWGGTGDEDPVTFEPRLPANRTYASVLANVDRFELTTFQPGFFYGSNIWSMGFDNLLIEIDTPADCAADFNDDGFVNPDDLADFITCFFLDVQFPGNCAAADFNGDTFRDPDDLADFITTFFIGCT
jgi:hypothetical protein